MAAAIGVRSDHTGAALRVFARRIRDPDQVRRLMAIARILDGESRCEAANVVSVTLHIVRDNWLPNRIFKSCGDIVDHCCFAWKKRVDQPWRIMSVGLGQWAHGC